MSVLFQMLSKRVDDWRVERYPFACYPAIREILEFAQDDDGQLRYLRRAQFRALETYWFLRLVLNTPRIADLYTALFPGLGERLQAMGVSPQLFAEANFDYPALVARIATDNAFVKQHGLESLRETLALDYPSYILALAMGAGKTILMGSIVATEFAMAQEYPDGPFVENALIFAPGKTILGALRELADVPYERLLPPRLFKPFAASLKLTFTRDGDKQIPITWGSSFNVIVTNTEKIRIQKPTARNGAQHRLFADYEAHEEEIEIAVALVKANAGAVEGLWFTGGLTSPDKTELLAEYLGEDGRWHHYTPDFVIRRADGKTLIVEIKADSESPDIAADLARHAKGEAAQTREGRKAVALKRWEDLNPDRLAYHVMFANGTLHDKDKKTVKDFIAGDKSP